MKLVEIINGTYGHRPVGSKYIEPKQAGDPPFEVEDGKAERLVSLGVAVYVDKLVETVNTTKKEPVSGVATAFKDGNGQKSGVNPPKEENGSENTQDVQEYSTDMKASELRELMEECGLTYKVGMSKADMVDALDAYFEDEGADEPPKLGAEDPIV